MLMISFGNKITQELFLFTTFGVGHQHRIIFSAFKILQGLECLCTAHCIRVENPLVGKEKFMEIKAFGFFQCLLYFFYEFFLCHGCFLCSKLTTLLLRHQKLLKVFDRRSKQRYCILILLFSALYKKAKQLGLPSFPPPFLFSR